MQHRILKVLTPADVAAVGTSTAVNGKKQEN